jgi:hypothetical protein
MSRSARRTNRTAIHGAYMVAPDVRCPGPDFGGQIMVAIRLTIGKAMPATRVC